MILASNQEQSGGMSTFDLWGIPTISALVAGAIFYIAGLANAVYIKRPKLVINGGGGGGSGSPTGFHVNHIGVQNAPGRLGIKVGQTIILGRRINDRHWFGWPVMRDAAKVCTAWLYDDSGNAIGGLYWRDPDDTQKRKLVIDLDSGERADLFLFAQRNDDIPNYYPYVPDSDGNPVMPPVKFSGTKRFIVRIMYTDGQQKREFKYTVTNDYQTGRISIRPGWHK